MAIRLTARAKPGLLVASAALAVGLFALRCGSPGSETSVPPQCDTIDCEDGNDCTEDICTPPRGPCEFLAYADGTLCETNGGVCVGGLCTPFTNRLPCTEQAILSAIELGGGPFFFDCDQTVETSQEIIIDNDVILDGEGKLTLDGGGSHRVLRVEPGVDAEIRGVTITGGLAFDPMFYTYGGGILNEEGTLRLVESTVYGNSADHGGGIASILMSTTEVVNSTLADNAAAKSAGGLLNFGTLTVVHTTFSNNTAPSGDALSALGPSQIFNTLIDGSCLGLGIESMGHNLESPGHTCNFDTIVDRSGVTPEELNLAPLSDNGGGMMTCALGPESVAIDAIPECNLTLDQRGVPRPQGFGCDIGATEWMECEAGAVECTETRVVEDGCEPRPIDDERPCGGGAGVCRAGDCVTRTAPTKVSGPKPFLPDCECELAGGCGRDVELAPVVTVNPQNPLNIVLAWMQGASLPVRGLVASATFDGGETWEPVVLPGLTECTGGDLPGVWRQWLAFAPNGDLYAASMSFLAYVNDRSQVTESEDGGRTWGLPTTVLPMDGGPPTIAADWTDPCTLHMSLALSIDGGVRQVRAARTTDCGSTWTEPELVYGTEFPELPAILEAQMLVLPDATPLVLFKNTLPGDVYAKRSPDRGASWPGQPTRISKDFPGSLAVVTPDVATTIYTAQGTPVGAVDQESGRVAVVWQQAVNQREPVRIHFAMSEDGGLTWSTPSPIDKTQPHQSFALEQTFLPAIAISSDGTIGVLYYSFENDTLGDDRADADVWFIHCQPGNEDCTSPGGWAQPVRLTRASFNFLDAIYLDAFRGEGLWVGDYMGLATVGTEFVAAFAVTGDTDAGDVLFVRIPIQ